MKYEPKNNKKPESEMEALMLPFVYGLDDDTDRWEIIDIVQQTVATLSEDDQTCLNSIFGTERETYAELSDTLGVKAKSHAWTKTQKALANLKQALLDNPRFQELTNGYSG
jgi:hypothetical protein